MSEHVSVKIVVDDSDVKKKKEEAKETQSFVNQIAANVKRINQLTRDQTILVATRAWTSTRSLFKLMGITMDANFAAIIEVGLATVQMYSSLAGIAASNPATWSHSVLFWSQAIAAGLSITVSIAAKIAAQQRIQEQQRLVNSIGDRYY